MECVNPNCAKRERVKALFSEEEENVSCPFCKEPLQRTSAIKKSKDEATSSTSNDEYTVNEEKSPEGKENTRYLLELLKIFNLNHAIYLLKKV